MTPTADLMKLVEKWRAEAAELRFEMGGNEAAVAAADATDACADKLAAALSSTGEARVGGEVGDFLLAAELDEWAQKYVAESGYANPTLVNAANTIRRLLLATPAQPKAPECHASPNGLHEDDCDDDGHSKSPGWCAWCSEQHGDHPKASEGKAGGDD